MLRISRGIRHVKDSAKRLDAARELCRQHGAQITAFYMTIGAFDLVIVIDAPNDEELAKLALSIAKGGTIRVCDAQGIRRERVPKDPRINRLTIRSVRVTTLDRCITLEYIVSHEWARP